jgi:hypothetical protein
MRFSQQHVNGTERPDGSSRRGMAIVITLILTAALGALAMSAVYLSSGSSLGNGLSNRSADLQYAADAALQVGKSYINADPDAMPETGYREITFNGGVLKDADGAEVRGVRVRMWAGPTGATSGQFGAYGSVIAEARDGMGGRVVRRLELAQENFARFAYWSNRENRNGSPIWFGGGDVIFGPTWSNDTIRIMNRGSLPFAAQFRDEFGTARVVINESQGDFWRGVVTNGRPIEMPAPAALSNLPAYATSGRMRFVAPSGGDESTVRMRIEFVNIDVDNDGSDTDPQDGFFRVYRLNVGGDPHWLRGDLEVNGGIPNGDTRRSLCGEWLAVPRVGGALRFFSVESHGRIAVRNELLTRGYDAGQLDALDFESSAPDEDEVREILSRTGVNGNRSQCFLGGAPELNVGNVGGTALTFQANDAQGAWLQYTGVIDPRVTARRGAEAQFLFPLHRSINNGARGVISVDGTVGISGTLVGRVTLHTTGTVVVLDDVRYGTNPATTGRCVDVLGLLAEDEVVVADNMLLNQVQSRPGSNSVANQRILDDSKDLILHAVVMTLNTSFRVENFGSGPTVGNNCAGNTNGRGCLMLLGGLIQEARGPVGTSANTGYLKQYTYDRCANLRPPPYFPTTGRYLDNRYMEIDPVTFNIATLFQRLTPTS